MSQKYWCKIDDGVEGPYEPQALRFIDGFTPDILVSPDTPDAEETWTRVSDVAELQALLNLSPKPGPAPIVIDAAPPVTEQTLEMTVPASETLPEDWGFETTQEIQTTVEPHAPTPTPFEATMEMTANPVEPKEEFVSSTDMLDLMEKISQELEQKKSEPEKQIPVPEPVAAPAPAPRAEHKPKRNFRKPALIAASLLVAAGLTFLAVKTGKPKIWFDMIASKFHKKEAPAPAPVADAPAEPVNPMPAPGVAQRKRNPAVKRDDPVVAVAVMPEPELEPEPEPEPIAQRTPEGEKELATQKFYLPGVPSPKLSSSRFDASQPLPVEDPLVPAIEKEKPKEVKKSESKKRSEKSDWVNEASWGN